MSHIVNNFDYLPYGEPNRTNIHLYDSFIYKLNPVQQDYWINKFYNSDTFKNLLQLVNIPIIARKCILNLTYNRNCQPTNLRVCLLSIKKHGEIDFVTNAEIWTSTEIFYAVFKADVDNSDFVEVSKWIALREGIEETFSEHTYNGIWQENALAVMHYLFHGDKVGYYRDFDETRQDYFANDFIEVTPRQAFIDNNLPL